MINAHYFLAAIELEKTSPKEVSEETSESNDTIFILVPFICVYHPSAAGYWWGRDNQSTIATFTLQHRIASKPDNEGSPKIMM